MNSTGSQYGTTKVIVKKSLTYANNLRRELLKYGVEASPVVNPLI